MIDQENRPTMHPSPNGVPAEDVALGRRIGAIRILAKLT